MFSRSTIRQCRAAPSGCASPHRRITPTPTSSIWFKHWRRSGRRSVSPRRPSQCLARAQHNAASGQVKALQRLAVPGELSRVGPFETNYAAVAQALGCNGIRVEDPADLAEALAKSLKLTGPPSL